MMGRHVIEMSPELRVDFDACMTEAQAEVEAEIEAMDKDAYDLLMAGDEGERGIKKMLTAAMERRGWVYKGPMPEGDA